MFQDTVIIKIRQVDSVIEIPVLTRIPLLKLEGMSPEDDGGRLELSAETLELKLVEYLKQILGPENLRVNELKS